MTGPIRSQNSDEVESKAARQSVTAAWGQPPEQVVLEPILRQAAQDLCINLISQRNNWTDITQRFVPDGAQFPFNQDRLQALVEKAKRDFNNKLAGVRAGVIESDYYRIIYILIIIYMFEKLQNDAELLDKYLEEKADHERLKLLILQDMRAALRLLRYRQSPHAKRGLDLSHLPPEMAQLYLKLSLLATAFSIQKSFLNQLKRKLRQLSKSLARTNKDASDIKRMLDRNERHPDGTWLQLIPTLRMLSLLHDAFVPFHRDQLLYQFISAADDAMAKIESDLIDLDKLRLELLRPRPKAHYTDDRQAHYQAAAARIEQSLMSQPRLNLFDPRVQHSVRAALQAVMLYRLVQAELAYHAGNPNAGARYSAADLQLLGQDMLGAMAVVEQQAHRLRPVPQPSAASSAALEASQAQLQAVVAMEPAPEAPSRRYNRPRLVPDGYFPGTFT